MKHDAFIRSNNLRVIPFETRSGNTPDTFFFSPNQGISFSVCLFPEDLKWNSPSITNQTTNFHDCWWELTNEFHKLSWNFTKSHNIGQACNCYKIWGIFMKNGPNEFRENSRSFVNDHQTLSYASLNSLGLLIISRPNTTMCHDLDLQWRCQSLRNNFLI